MSVRVRAGVRVMVRIGVRVMVRVRVRVRFRLGLELGLGLGLRLGVIRKKTVQKKIIFYAAWDVSEFSFRSGCKRNDPFPNKLTRDVTYLNASVEFIKSLSQIALQEQSHMLLCKVSVFKR